VNHAPVPHPRVTPVPVTHPTASTARGLSAVLRLPGEADLHVLALLRHRGCLVELVLVLDDEPVRLPIDRALLTAGLTAPTRDGEVSVSTTGQRVSVHVAGLEVVLPLLDLAELLAASYEAVPTGAEHPAVVDLDASCEVRVRT